MTELVKSLKEENPPVAEKVISAGPKLPPPGVASRNDQLNNNVTTPASQTVMNLADAFSYLLRKTIFLLLNPTLRSPVLHILRGNIRRLYSQQELQSKKTPEMQKHGSYAHKLIFKLENQRKPR